MTLTEIQNALVKIGMRPTKSLGQNFLFDQNLTKWIVEQAGVGEGDRVLEIGPGLGALTEVMVEMGVDLRVVEKDGRLAEFLKKRFDGKRVEVFHQDALEVDIRDLFCWGGCTLIGNLPYYVTSPLLHLFFSEASPVEQAVIMVQRELAAKLGASVGDQDYGGLSLIVGRLWEVEYLRTVGGQVFYPEPKVASGIIRLTRRRSGELPLCHGKYFEYYVKRGFSQRRKQLRKLLVEGGVDRELWSGYMEKLGKKEGVRAEELSLLEWVELTNLLHPLGDAGAGQSADERFVIVNERDEVIGEETREQTHVNNLLHRAVHIWIYNERGDLFLQKRSERKDKYPGLWDSSAAGHVDAGEDYDQTAKRELHEELGIETELELVGKLDASEETGWEFIQVYRGKWKGKMQLAVGEIDYGFYFPVSMIRKWVKERPQDFASGFIECFALVEREVDV